MTKTNPSTPSRPDAAAGPVTSRRNLLRAGGLGLGAAAVLAACGSDSGEDPGVSGSPAPTTTAPPEVPATEPSDAALAMDITLLQTATSLELVVADTYTSLGSRITDAALADEAKRFATDHGAAADAFAEATPAEDRIDEPNEVIQTQLIDPIMGTLEDDDRISSFLADLESMLVATYCTAAGTFTTTEDRRLIMEHGGAAARRVGALLGTDAVPMSGLYSLEDLIPAAAYIGAPSGEEGAEGEEGSEGSGGEGSDPQGSGAEGDEGQQGSDDDDPEGEG